MMVISCVLYSTWGLIHRFHSATHIMIALDDTFSKKTYQEMIFCCTIIDINNQIYIVSLEIKDSKNDVSWK